MASTTTATATATATATTTTTTSIKNDIDIDTTTATATANNGEAAPPTTAEATIEYILSDELAPFENPDTHFQGLIEGLESKDWIKICESLNDTRRLALYHSSLLLPLIEPVMVVMVKSIKNPRSALCKTTIMAAADIFTAYRDKLVEPTLSGAFDSLLLQLLLKASQDKRFVCEEAEKTLNAMVLSLNPLGLLQKLQTYAGHTNPKVRAKAATYLSNSISRLSLEELQEFGMVSLVQAAAKLLNDRLPEAREAARSIIMSVYNLFPETEDQKQESWQNFCESNLPALHGQSIIKITTSH